MTSDEKIKRIKEIIDALPFKLELIKGSPLDLALAEIFDLVQDEKEDPNTK